MIAPLLAAALALNPQVTPATIQTTICTHGYASSIRPPVSYTAPIKRHLLPPGGRMSAYVLDHIVSLELGRSARDPANLQLQTIADGKAKDRVERRLHTAVCQGRISLREAQEQVAGWKP